VGLDHLKGNGVNINNTFFDHQSQSALAFLQVHQGRNRNSDRLPFGEIHFQMFNRRHLTGGAGGNQAEDGEPQIISIYTIKTGGVIASAVIPVKMNLGFETRHRFFKYFFNRCRNFITRFYETTGFERLAKGFEGNYRGFHHQRFIGIIIVKKRCTVLIRI